MLTKESCHDCGTHIEFDADQIGNEGYTILCPKCQAPVTLLRPPPIAAPPFIKTKKRSRLWIWMLALITIAFAMLLFLMMVPALNHSLTYGITPEPDYSQKTPQIPLTSLDNYVFDLGLKELNKQFYKSGDFVFVHLFRTPDINMYS